LSHSCGTGAEGLEPSTSWLTAPRRTADFHRSRVVTRGSSSDLVDGFQIFHGVRGPRRAHEHAHSPVDRGRREDRERAHEAPSGRQAGGHSTVWPYRALNGLAPQQYREQLEAQNSTRLLGHGWAWVGGLPALRQAADVSDSHTHRAIPSSGPGFEKGQLRTADGWGGRNLCLAGGVRPQEHLRPYGWLRELS